MSTNGGARDLGAIWIINMPISKLLLKVSITSNGSRMESGHMVDILHYDDI